MGANFRIRPCSHCQTTVSDCFDHVFCSCKRMWCSEKCAAHGKLRNDRNEKPTCKFCRKEDVEDSILLKFLLEWTTWSRKDAVRMYFADQEESRDDPD